MYHNPPTNVESTSAMNKAKLTNKMLLLLFACVLVIGLISQTYHQPYIPELDKVISAGEITIITRNTPTTYYNGAEGPTGFEYELAKEFADFLKVTPTFIVTDEFSTILPDIHNRKANFAAAGITVTNQRTLLADFSNSYQEITQLIIYKGGEKKARNISQLAGHIIDVIKGSSHEERLVELKKQHPQLQWRTHENVDINYLFEKLNDGDIKYLICDSNDFEFNRRFYPALRKGFQISEKQELAWVFPKSKDRSLLNAANEYLTVSKQNGYLDQLYEKHYSHIPGLNYAGAHTFLNHLNSRLEDLIPIFKEVAENHELDWRFLAAISYQESLWNPEAVSPTGVRGLMMLTHATAKELGVKDRTNPIESTHGGATYLSKMKKRIPKRISEPDRTWMALAAYNIGLGHLEDARVLTQRKGGNPDKWVDVRKTLPLLTQKEWYKQTKYGYARGHEPVLYVKNVRNYYDLLIWKYNEKDSIQDTMRRIIPKVF